MPNNKYLKKDIKLMTPWSQYKNMPLKYSCHVTGNHGEGLEWNLGREFKPQPEAFLMSGE